MNKIFSYKMHFASLLCTILIAFSHVYGVFYYLHNAPIKVYNIFLRISALAYISMTYFFFMSAYWLFRTYQPSQYINKLKSRFHSIVIPYIIFCLVGLIVKIIVNNGSVVLNINTVFDAIFLTDYNGPLWYLLKLFILVILTPFLYQIIKRKKYV